MNADQAVLRREAEHHGDLDHFRRQQWNDDLRDKGRCVQGRVQIEVKLGTGLIGDARFANSHDLVNVAIARRSESRDEPRDAQKL